jgi:hypothetical protein
MKNLSIRKEVEAYIGLRATCTYNAKTRYGHIAAVKQGRAIRQDDGEFTYLNEPWAEVYIDWQERGSVTVKCLKWSKVTAFILEEAPKPKATEQAVASEPKQDTKPEDICVPRSSFLL